MLTILAAVFVFGVLVTVHEFGHFITAKLTGMRVDEFAIGFGPKLYQQKDGDTLYSLRAIPLGGYNKIAGMDPDDPPEPGTFKSKPIPSRMLVILAGALMNFLFYYSVQRHFYAGGQTGAGERTNPGHCCRRYGCGKSGLA